MPDLFFSLPCAQTPSTITGHEREPAFPFTFCSQLGSFCTSSHMSISEWEDGLCCLLKTTLAMRGLVFILVQNAATFFSGIISCS